MAHIYVDANSLSAVSPFPPSYRFHTSRGNGFKVGSSFVIEKKTTPRTCREIARTVIELYHLEPEMAVVTFRSGLRSSRGILTGAHSSEEPALRIRLSGDNSGDEIYSVIRAAWNLHVGKPWKTTLIMAFSRPSRPYARTCYIESPLSGKASVMMKIILFFGRNCRAFRGRLGIEGDFRRAARCTTWYNQDVHLGKHADARSDSLLFEGARGGMASSHEGQHFYEHDFGE
ncbi:hypothetical protein ACRALDRAFT_205914 [Sodiomyces alcalophilus JCM 7366]|uniref:uncharacterized protein n=1 Tax=Sodiomyces alcalophilus JCM 7366 TaxID=591952 RepID=UPI0039B37F0E